MVKRRANRVVDARHMNRKHEVSTPRRRARRRRRPRPRARASGRRRQQRWRWSEYSSNATPRCCEIRTLRRRAVFGSTRRSFGWIFPVGQPARAGVYAQYGCAHRAAFARRATTLCVAPRSQDALCRAVLVKISAVAVKPVPHNSPATHRTMKQRRFHIESSAS